MTEIYDMTKDTKRFILKLGTYTFVTIVVRVLSST